MELIFLGRGAGFNPAEGSTSAYFIDNDELFLIDCGESIFKTIIEKKLLDSVSALNLFITHTHTDHVGSIGSLILYASVIKKIKITIAASQEMAYLAKIQALMNIAGLSAHMYTLTDVSEYNGKYSAFSQVKYFKTDHCKEVESCGILFETAAGLIIYSGDLNNPEPILKLIGSGKKIDKIYIDSSNDPEPNFHHISIHQLKNIIPPELKDRVYCMHINNEACIKEALAYGFKTVECK